jgi:adenylate kinase family enzyme
MQRILVIGSPGAGKSTLARRIAETLGLPLIHLDQEYWSAGWVEPARETWFERVAALARRPAWVMDGNYSGTMSSRLPQATLVVWLDVPRWRCMLRVLKRIARYRGSVRPDMAEGCPERLSLEFLRYVWTYEKRHRSETLALMRTLRPDQRGITLRNPHEIAAFMDELTPRTMAA